ncbi:MAG: Hint domain-containing protein [Micromonosporaceae bacterium]
MRRLVSLAAIVLSVAGCGVSASPGGQQTPPTATVSPTGATAGATTPPAVGAATAWRLRYVLLGQYPDFAYCDPDLYPVARMDEQPAADDWWAGADQKSPEVQEILAHHGYHEPLTPNQRLAAYRDHKKLTVIAMTAVSGGYSYQLAISSSGDEPDQSVTGVVTTGGQVHEASRRPRPGGCPICLEAGTRIATPDGEVPVAQLRPGDLVWTVDGAGRRVAGPVERIIRRVTSGPHLMLRLALSDGRVLVAAGAHPGVDGTYLRELRTGQRYDGATVESVAWVMSVAPATVDLLPAGRTGAYWANGILVGSTLKP